MNSSSLGVDGKNKNEGKYLEIPKDKKAIIDMLVKPQKFGTGLFDYSCQGANWIYADSAVLFTNH